MAALTERQQEIKDLQKQGKKAPEIADALGITTNAVYQQLRRMRGGSSRTSATAKPKASAKKSTAKSGRKSGAKSGDNAPLAPATPVATETRATKARDMTPLQAVRARRQAITAGIKEAEAAVAELNRKLDQARASLEKAQAKIADELKQLDAAEAALTGKPVAEAPAESTPEDVFTPEPVKPADEPVAETETVKEAVAEDVAAKPVGEDKSKKSTGKSGAKGTQGNGTGTQPPPQPVAEEPPPLSQPEREATAEHDGTASDPFETDTTQAAAEVAAKS